MNTIKILTIGNSFARNALKYLRQIAKSTDGVRFVVGRANLGGCSLEKHSNLADFTQKHPDYKGYRLCENNEGQTVYANLQDALTYENWDFVTLQQVSLKSWLQETFEPYLGLLHSMVSDLAPQANCLLHQTWAYRSDSPFLVENCMAQRMMFDRIRDNYNHFGDKYGCGVLFSGAAVQKVRETPGHDFKWPDTEFDYQHAEPFDLPEQVNSLAVGWKWGIEQTVDGIPQLRLDPNHLNDAGCYLVGCVWFEQLTKKSIYESDFIPEGIGAKHYELLRRVAHEVAAGHSFFSL